MSTYVPGVIMPLLSDLIDLPEQPLISLVGAGGKTTTMYTLARELAHRGKRVITTTTTQIFTPAHDETEKLIVEDESVALLHRVKTAWEYHRHITVASSVDHRGKLMGLPTAVPALLIQEAGADVVIIEADGARHRFIKAPAEHEPVVPPETNVALLLMSARAIHQPLNEEVAHRPERIAAVTGIHIGDMLTPAIIARLLTSEVGALKNIPASAQVYLLITHTASERREGVLELARLVHQSGRITDVLCSEEVGVWFDT
jgi:probable selenium-dependent hydroxylase accessory protein YqeC